MIRLRLAEGGDPLGNLSRRGSKGSNLQSQPPVKARPSPLMPAPHDDSWRGATRRGAPLGAEAGEIRPRHHCGTGLLLGHPPSTGPHLLGVPHPAAVHDKFVLARILAWPACLALGWIAGRGA